MPSDAPILEVKGLTWSPPGEDRAPVVADFQLTVEAGERVVLTGPSGAGKSTVLRCIIGLGERDKGTIHWQGNPVGADNIRAFRRAVAYIQQRPTDVAGTLGENLEFAREMARESAHDHPVEPLDEKGQRNLLNKLGLSSVEWSRRFDDLSVGEQQRVALVRSLTLQPDVLLLDEPTSALDEERVSDIETLLIDYVDARPERRAFVWVTHQAEQGARVGTRSASLPVK